MLSLQWELYRNNMFAGVAFSSYGGFWLGFGLYGVLAQVRTLCCLCIKHTHVHRKLLQCATPRAYVSLQRDDNLYAVVCIAANPAPPMSCANARSVSPAPSGGLNTLTLPQAGTLI